jgi:transcriptional regulator with GAF, ATPase, and Fis domain
LRALQEHEFERLGSLLGRNHVRSVVV